MILALKAETLADGFRQSIDTCGQLKPSQRLTIAFLIYVIKSLASGGLLSFRSSSGERATLIAYDDLAPGGRQISGHIGEKNS